MVMFVFDPMSLIVVVVGCFMGGFLPLLVLIGMTPEAKTFIKARISSCVIISKSNDAGYREFIAAQPYGSEGQFLAGKNEFGQREIYVRPPSTDPVFSKSFILKGIRRPILDAYEGKTVAVSPAVTAAIAAAEAGKELPENIRAWAEANQISVREPETIETTATASDPANPDKPMTFTTKKTKFSYVKKKLFLINPVMLRTYFQTWYTQSQFDVMLDKAYQYGYMRGLGLRKESGLGNKKLLVVGVVIMLAVAGVGLVLLLTTGGGK